MLHDCEAEAAPTGGPRAITPVKALEETRQVVRIDPDTVVGGGNDNVAAILANRQSEGRAGTGIANRVLRQVLDDHLEHSRPQRDRGPGLRVKGKADTGPISTLAKLFRDFVENRLRIVQPEED